MSNFSPFYLEIRAAAAAGLIEADHVNADLCVRDSPKAREILKKHSKLSEGGICHGRRQPCFLYLGNVWFEIPFGYEPYFHGEEPT